MHPNTTAIWFFCWLAGALACGYVCARTMLAMNLNLTSDSDDEMTAHARNSFYAGVAFSVTCAAAMWPFWLLLQLYIHSSKPAQPSPMNVRITSDEAKPGNHWTVGPHPDTPVHVCYSGDLSCSGIKPCPACLDVLREKGLLALKDKDALLTKWTAVLVEEFGKIDPGKTEPPFRMLHVGRIMEAAEKWHAHSEKNAPIEALVMKFVESLTPDQFDLEALSPEQKALLQPIIQEVMEWQAKNAEPEKPDV